MSAEKRNIVISTNNFPGYGYEAGGAQRHVQLLAENLKKYGAEILVTRTPDPEGGPEFKTKIIGGAEPSEIVDKFREDEGDAAIHYVSNAGMLLRPEFIEPMTEIMGNRPTILRATSQGVVSGFEQDPEKWKPHLEKMYGFVSQADELTDQLRRALAKMGIENPRIWQIKNGVDTELFHPISERRKKVIRQEKLGWGDEIDTVFVYSGRVGTPIKKVDEIIEQFLEQKLDEDSGLLLVGTYDNTPYGIELYEKYHGKHNIHFTGPVDHEELGQLVAASDVFVSASTSEGFSNSTLEAEASGLSVIAREGVSGNSDMVINDETGYLFSESKQLGEMMSKMRDPELKARMGRNSRDLVASKFGVDYMIRQYEDMFDQILKSQKAVETV